MIVINVHFFLPHISILAAFVVYVCSLILFFFFFCFSLSNSLNLHSSSMPFIPIKLFLFFLFIFFKLWKHNVFGGYSCILSKKTTFWIFPFHVTNHFGVWLCSPCPEYRTIRQADGTRIRSCIYSLDSRPYYRNSLRNFSFVFDMANALPPALPVKQHIAAIDIDAHS